MAPNIQFSRTVAERLSSYSIQTYALVFLSLAVVWFARWATQRPPMDQDAPPFVGDSKSNDTFAAWRFFSKRWEFFQDGTMKGVRNFSFWIGKYPMVALSGAKAREIFYSHKSLSVNEGYSIFFGLMPASKITGKNGEDISQHDSYEVLLNKAVTKMYARDKMNTYLPAMIDQLLKGYDTFLLRPSGKINPFQDLYRQIYTLAMLVWGCAEITRDPKSLNTMYSCYESFKFAFTPATIVFPWLPTLATFTRLKLGATIWWTLRRTIEARRESGTRENDIVQAMLDGGESTGNIIGVVMSLLLAGHAQLGANAAWILTFLATEPEWMDRARREVREVADRHSADPSLSLREKLRALPLEAWEAEFPTIELCFRDSMRLNTTFACFRRNMGREGVRFGGEKVPSGWFCTYHMADVNLDPKIHRDPERWDPSRFLDAEGREKVPQPEFIGFGAGRHPCVGARFARVAETIITALFLATFDFDLVDEAGEKVTEQPRRDFNAYKESGPLKPVFLRYRAAQSMEVE